MTDAANQPNDEIETYVEDADPNAVEVEATLIHGEVYYLGNTRFNKGVPVPVTNEQRDQLEDVEHAADQLSFEGADGIETQSRSKFTFAAVGAGVKPVAAPVAAPEAAAPPRRRGPAPRS